jgi:hypothetical protein
MMSRESGHVGAGLLLLFQLGLQLAFFMVIRTSVDEYERAYAWIEERQQGTLSELPETQMIWGEPYSSLPPRIDFGAYTQKGKDAEALCYFVRLDPSLAGASNFRCD